MSGSSLAYTTCLHHLPATCLPGSLPLSGLQPSNLMSAMSAICCISLHANSADQVGGALYGIITGGTCVAD